jgi:GNAT superfamily N-acetyltransferase
MSYGIQLTDVADPAVREALVAPLLAYNVQQTGRSNFRLLILTLTDANGRVVGGLWGRTVYDWLFVELLVVPETMRGRGIGTELMQRAEGEAVARGCHSAWLDTFQFQARGFYEKLGYSCFAELADYPPGFSRYFMKKTLAADQ